MDRTALPRFGCIINGDDLLKKVKLPLILAPIPTDCCWGKIPLFIMVVPKTKMEVCILLLLVLVLVLHEIGELNFDRLTYKRRETENPTSEIKPTENLDS